MSILEKQSQEVIRKAKYRVKNSDGKYEIVYLETSADQVETTEDLQFISAAEKAKITANESAIAAETSAREEADDAIKGRLDIIEGEDSVDGSIKKALKDSKDYTDEQVRTINSASEELKGRVDTLEANIGEGTVDSRIEAAKKEVQGEVSALESRVETNESDISNLKDALANKNSNTIVVNTEAEIATTNTDPKVGDLAYVISSKRAYIYKGLNALTAKNAPEGWIVFDEITSELDLVNYLKVEDAALTYRRLDTKIAEADLDELLSSKINAKVEATYVDSKVEEVVSPVRDKAEANEKAIAKEVLDRTGEISRVEGLVSAETTAREEAINSAKEELNTLIEAVDTKADTIESEYKAADEKINEKLNNFVTAVQEGEPVGTEAGHVWLEIKA